MAGVRIHNSPPGSALSFVGRDILDDMPAKQDVPNWIIRWISKNRETEFPPKDTWYIE